MSVTCCCLSSLMGCRQLLQILSTYRLFTIVSEMQPLLLNLSVCISSSRRSWQHLWSFDEFALVLPLRML